MTLQSFFLDYRQRLDSKLREILSAKGNVDPILKEQISYSVFAGGKRLRPLLAYASAHAVGGRAEHADIPACALELIHTYSLIHDDLPAMDDDVLRRGHATAHVKFDEATAILSGDALQTLAFKLLSTTNLLPVGNKIQLKMIHTLSQAAGASGMVAGQQLDTSIAGKEVSLELLEKMHRLKTGALISASVELGALSTNIATKDQLTVLAFYADSVGLAFQVHDDILDVTSTSQRLGKTSGRDKALNKPTYVDLLGVGGAQQKCVELIESAIDHLIDLPSPEYLIELARFINQRDH